MLEFKDHSPLHPDKTLKQFLPSGDVVEPDRNGDKTIIPKPFDLEPNTPSFYHPTQTWVSHLASRLKSD